MCERSYVNKRNLLRHIREAHASLWSCQRCSKTFNREDNFTYHVRTCDFHANGVVPPPVVQTGFGAVSSSTDVVVGDFQELEQAFDKTAISYRLNFDKIVQTPQNIYEILKKSINSSSSLLDVYQNENNGIKFQFNLRVHYHQASDKNMLTEPAASHNGKPREVYAVTDIDDELVHAIKELEGKIDEYEQRGSGWVLDHLVRVDLYIYNLDPLRGSTYIPLSQWLVNKKALVNIKNKDNFCFGWSVLAKLYGNPSDHHPERVSHYKEHKEKLNFKGIEMPMELKDIPKF